MADSPDTDDLLDLLQPSPGGWQWVVVHARPRCEKKVEALRRLKPARIFLPTLERVHNYGNRVRVNHIPMFPGYVFAMIQTVDKPWFRQNNQVANLLEVPDEAKFLRPLRAVAEAMRSGMELEVLPFVKPGQKVRITGGPMKGLEAEITEVRGKNKVVLRLELIQQSVALEIAVSYLKAVE